MVDLFELYKCPILLMMDDSQLDISLYAAINSLWPSDAIWR